MKQQLIVQKELYIQNQRDNNVYLQTALRSLANASQVQFEEMKKEKWYHRVFDLLTFSQKGKKRVAEQISTVSQAQQILAELLVNLSDYDVVLAEMIRDNAEYVHQLAKQNVCLATTVKALEQNIKYGSTRHYDVNRLSDSQKKVLVFCLFYLAENQDSHSKYQTAFFNQIIDYADQPILDFDECKMMEQLDAIDDIHAKRVILMSCLEYLFLKHSSEKQFLESKDGADLIYHFDFGEKTVCELKKYILKTYKAVGEFGIINKYSEEVLYKTEAGITSEFEYKEWDVKSIKEWYRKNAVGRNCELHILDADMCDLSSYKFKNIAGQRNQGIILVVYDRNLKKSCRHSCLDREQVNKNILNKLKKNGGIIYV